VPNHALLPGLPDAIRLWSVYTYDAAVVAPPLVDRFGDFDEDLLDDTDASLEVGLAEGMLNSG